MTIIELRGLAGRNRRAIDWGRARNARRKNRYPVQTPEQIKQSIEKMSQYEATHARPRGNDRRAEIKQILAADGAWHSAPAIAVGMGINGSAGIAKACRIMFEANEIERQGAYGTTQYRTKTEPATTETEPKATKKAGAK
jgi:hypothetical protein